MENKDKPGLGGTGLNTFCAADGNGRNLFENNPQKIFCQEISVFNGVNNPNPIGTLTISQVLEDIRHGKWKNQIENVRSVKDDKTKYDALKEELKAVTFSCTVKYRGLTANPKKPHSGPHNLLTTTGIIVADLDEVENPSEIKVKLKGDPNILFVFISPGGGGLKVGLYCQISCAEDHKKFFSAVQLYFLNAYGLKIDKLCSDIARLCYVSYDPELHVNEHACQFLVENWKTEPPPPPPLPPLPEGLVSQAEGWQKQYAVKVLDTCCAAIRDSAQGEMHFTRLTRSRLVGGYVAGGYLDEEEAWQALEAAVRDSGTNNLTASMRTIKDGLEHGKLNPLHPGDLISSSPQIESQSSIINIPSGEELRARAKQLLEAQTPCPPFNPEHLPEKLRQYIKEISLTTSADPIIATSSVYGTISGVTGRKVYMEEGEYFQQLYPNLWMITTCKSGFFKTTGLNKGSKIAQEVEAEISKEILGLHEQRMKIDPNKKNEIKEIDKKIAELEIQSPILPNRSTAEGLIDLLARGHAGTNFLSEFGDWLKTMEQQYNSGLKALFTDLYDVPRQRTYRTRTGGTLIINRPFISICGVSTLTWVKENIRPEDVSSGFFARFLLFYPPQEFVVPPALPAKGKIQDSSVEEEIKQILQDVKPDTVMELSDESEKAFIRVHESLYHNLEQMSEKNHEILGPYVKRWSPYILKIAMLNQLIIEPGSTVISLEALRGAISIVEYAMKSTTYLFENDLGESENQRKCRVVLEFIAKRNGQATRQAILSSKTLGGGAKDYDYILETLEESGKVLIENKGQKKDWIYSLNSVC